MISVIKKFDKPPKILTSQECMEKIEQALKEKDKHNYCTQCCGEKVRDQLKKIYNNKCAYCETDINAGAFFNIEHYRPRKKPRGEKDHKGYYWLTYEWSNLLLACPKCNFAKSNIFLLEPAGKRRIEPVFENGRLSKKECFVKSATLSSEIPLLLHPEIDTPEAHFKFLPNGRIKGTSERGRWTIKICKLNREDLVLDRKKLVDRFSNNIRRLLLAFKRKKNKESFLISFSLLLDEIRELKQPDRIYSRFGWFMFHKFDSFFTKKLGEKQKKVVRCVYESFIENGSGGK